MNIFQSRKQSLSICPTQSTLKSQHITSPSSYPFTSSHQPKSQKTQMQSPSRCQSPLNNFKVQQILVNRSKSNKATARLKGQIFGKTTLKDKLSEAKIREKSEKKVLPDDLKIVYYGPIGKVSSKTKENYKVQTPKKLQTQDVEIEKFQPKSMQVDTIIQTISPKSRYYDMNSTKESLNETKKLSVTYYPMVEDAKRKSSSITKTCPKIQLQIIIYGLLFVTGIILLFGSIFT